MKNHETQSGEPLRILAIHPDRNSTNPVVKQIKKYLPEGTILISAGRRNTDFVMSGLTRVKRKHGPIKRLIKEDRFSGTYYVPKADLTVNESAFIAIDHIQRRTKQFTWNFHTLESVYDSKNYYHIVLDMLTNFLAKEQINLVLFFDIPHLFYDSLVYQVAKSKGIRTLVVTSSIFPNRFFSFNKIEDIGNFPFTCSNDSNSPYPIDSDKNPEWYYTKHIKQYKSESGKLHWRGILRLFWSLVAVERYLLVNPKLISQTLSRMRIIAANLPKWRDPFRGHFHTSHLGYYERILLHENLEIDFDRKFVYFPLQLQPEMTTSTLGGYYSDQLLAIEQLSRLLPENSWIYVKENPKQTGVMRGPQFFERLDRIPNLIFLPSHANTFDLIDNSEFVATVTGTVGWEAICKGKKVLVFGIPWYRNLPGVIQFHQGITYETICNTVTNHKILELQTGILFSRSKFGDPWHPDVSLTLENNSMVNTDAFAKSIVDLIENRIENTFVKR